MAPAVSNMQGKTINVYFTDFSPWPLDQVTKISPAITNVIFKDFSCSYNKLCMGVLECGPTH